MNFLETTVGVFAGLLLVWNLAALAEAARACGCGREPSAPGRRSSREGRGGEPPARLGIPAPAEPVYMIMVQCGSCGDGAGRGAPLEAGGRLPRPGKPARLRAETPARERGELIDVRSS